MLKIEGRFLRRNKDEKIVAVTDSISYKMIEEELRNDLTFAFKVITYKQAEDLINSNVNNCVGAVGHRDFAINLNRLLDIDYKIPYGRGRERVHLTLQEGDYVVIISRISNRATTYDNNGRYSRIVNKDDIWYTLAKVIKTPETEFVIGDLNEGVSIEG